MKIDVVQLTYRRFNIYTHTLVQQMVNTSARKHDVEVKQVLGNSVVHQSRNKSLQMLRTDCDAYLFIDDDMLPNPLALNMLLDKMQEHDLPAVSALCTGRQIPLKYSLFMFDKDKDMFYSASYVAEEPAILGHGELAGNYATGLAFFLLRHDALTAAMTDYFNAGDWRRDVGNLALALGANPSTVDNYAALLGHARKIRWQNGKWNDFFKLSPQTGFNSAFVERQRLWEQTAGKNKPEMPLDLSGTEAFQMTESISEDLSMCRRLHHLDIPIAIDTGVRVAHLGNFAYGPYCIDAGLDSDVLFQSGAPKGYSPAIEALLAEEQSEQTGFKQLTSDEEEIHVSNAEQSHGANSEAENDQG